MSKNYKYRFLVCFILLLAVAVAFSPDDTSNMEGKKKPKEKSALKLAIASYTEAIPKMIEQATGMDERICSAIYVKLVMFMLSLCINFIEDPSYRKWYSSTIGIGMYYYWCGVNYIYSLAMLVVAWKVM